jgi:hypothetical protein
MAQVFARRIAVKDLQEEELDRHDRMENSFSPDHALFPAHLCDRLLVELPRPLVLELTHHFAKIVYHP